MSPTAVVPSTGLSKKNKFDEDAATDVALIIMFSTFSAVVSKMTAPV